MSWQPPPSPGPGPGGPQPAAKMAPGTGNFYNLLMVDPAAHPTIVRYAYRYLAGIYHPDNVESGNAEMFRLISEAFRTLQDPGRRQAYDMQIGLAAHQQQAAGGAHAQAAAAAGYKGTLPKTGLSWNEVELRLAVLQVLLEARKKRAQTGGCSAKVLMDVLKVEMADMEFVLWYLREKGYVARGEALFQITVPGVDYLVDSLSKTQVLDESSRSSKAPLNINLPATLGSN